MVDVGVCGVVVRGAEAREQGGSVARGFPFCLSLVSVSRIRGVRALGEGSIIIPYRLSVFDVSPVGFGLCAVVLS